MNLINANPEIFSIDSDSFVGDFDDSVDDPLGSDEVFQLIRHINDPEHPLSLEQLNVAQKQWITINGSQVDIRFKPTIPHCSMATLIGLCIRVKLLYCLPKHYRVSIRVLEDSHQSEHGVNKQLNDKERVAAALENQHLLSVVHQCLSKIIVSNDN